MNYRNPSVRRSTESFPANLSAARRLVKISVPLF